MAAVGPPPAPRPSGIPLTIPNLTAPGPLVPPPGPLAGQIITNYPNPAAAPIAWQPIPNITPAINALLLQLQNQIQHRRENERRYNEEVFRRISNLLIAAKIRGNGNISLTPALQAQLSQLLQQLIMVSGDSTEVDNTSAQALLSQLTTHDPNLSLRGGWTPKPKPKRTKRVLKKRKTRVK
jgi:hypothetical protein